jgi:hypothetical protein
LSTVLIPPWKYRSQARKKLLEACAVLLRAVRGLRQRNTTEFATLGASP